MTYGFKQSKAGLMYIALGIGITAMSQMQGRLMDRVYGFYTRKNGGVTKPEYRLYGPSSCTHWIIQG